MITQPPLIPTLQPHHYPSHYTQYPRHQMYNPYWDTSYQPLRYSEYNPYVFDYKTGVVGSQQRVVQGGGGLGREN